MTFADAVTSSNVRRIARSRRAGEIARPEPVRLVDQAESKDVPINFLARSARSSDASSLVKAPPSPISFSAIFCPAKISSVSAGAKSRRLGALHPCGVAARCCEVNMQISDTRVDQ
jgi:hypothetical protein